ncbi:MAG TPA: sigma-70 family RNA polymerase sigma factor [Spirochaetota bacterium]|nr:sigma-70 family RNA polymerase sigma factor [Spirochaetota bacterium]HPI89951.1 sigma-70 family RNA polymerase sigma factor [Spirochaetota bacterium]HPR48450.1 sigma-70 family RNA polymerase sigma factor [Spirochaetota bacterium]
MDRACYEKAFSAVYERFYNPLHRFICSIVHNRELSQDIIHDIFLKIYEKRIPLEPESKKIFTFLCTMSKNRAIDQIKRMKNENDKYHEIAYQEVALDRDFYHDAEESYIEGEVVSTLHDVLNTISLEHRIFFINHIFNDMPVSGMALESGMSAYHVKKIIQKVNNEMKDKLRDFFYEDLFIPG